jgi:hypothetical protein
LGELWAAVLNSVPHRPEAIGALHRTLVALTDGTDSEQIAARLGAAIIPLLSARALHVLKLALPDPERAEKISAQVVAAFLGAQQKAIGGSK